LAIGGETGAILQGFLSRPEELLLPGSKHSGLTQTGSVVNGDGVSGRTILGILETLMETFTADLKAMQEKEKQGIETYTSTKTAKQTSISAMQASTSTKESQLAHYTTMNAQAKEDLAYLRETNKFDTAYLQQVRDQCSSSENEFKIRKKTREDEIAALTEGISILTAGSGVSGSAAAATKTLLHTSAHVKKVFFHHHTSPTKRAVLKVAKGSVPAAPKPAAAEPVKKAPNLLQIARSEDTPLHSLATLKSRVLSRVLVAQRQSIAGPLTGGAIKSVVTQVDVVVMQLKTQKKNGNQEAENLCERKERGDGAAHASCH